MSATFLAIAIGLAVLAALLICAPLWRYRQPGQTGRSLALGGVLIVVLPLAVFALYVRVTTYPWDNPDLLTAPAPGSPQEVEQMVSQLAVRMLEEPTLDGLAMLGRSYMTLQRYEEAVEVYHKAWEMTEGQNPNVSLAYAEALILADRDTIRTSAADLLDAVLVDMPDEPRALWYGGLSSLARGRAEEGQARWVRLLALPDLPDQLRLVVQQQLAALNGEGGQQQPAQPTAAADGPRVDVTVELSDTLKAELTPTARLFVFLRRGASPAPLAVTRVRPGSFPQTVQLSDDDVMIKSNSLSDPGTLTLVARLSLRGDATAAPGDLYGETTLDWNGDSANVSVVIDRVVAD